MSSLLMVLLLLTLGSLLLEGLNRSSGRCWRKPPAKRRRSAIRRCPFRAAVGKTAGLVGAGAAGLPEQAPGWRACLRIFDDGSLLLSSASGEVQVWQSGEVRGGQVRFSAHGWSDFCPLREASLCQMP
jgi:hypothetical protein